MEKYVFSFKEGKRKLKNLLGGKGANLCEMLQLGLPVPQGFIVTTEACNNYLANNYLLNKTVQKEILEQLNTLEKRTGKKFGDDKQPLLLSVRSGSTVSMPGMMDTILNIGLNDKIVANYSEDEQLQWFIHDSYRRFIGMYAEVTVGLDKKYFDGELLKYKEKHQIDSDQDLKLIDLQNIIKIYKNNYLKLTKQPFPQEPIMQLLESIKAVFRSWHNERAITYRKMHNIADDLGTAVTIQEMVYGNNGNNSGTGVVFSRNPATGANHLYGEYLINAQGEDVVAGIRTPLPIEKLKKALPDCYDELFKWAKFLEKHYKDVQDIEFTIENGKLYILQTRTGKRTMKAAVKIAIDLVKESLISKEQAILRIDSNQIAQLLHPSFNEKELAKATKITQGLPASPGAASGQVYFSKEKLLKADNKNPKILVREETSPDDIEGMINSAGILTVYGGMTSHAAVVARGAGICCVSGCHDIKIKNNKMIVNDQIINEGDFISLDGTTGHVFLGEISKESTHLDEYLEKLLKWASQYLKMTVLANADTANDVKKALSFQATGVGLCRTEHMFFQQERILQVQKMILANDEESRNQALAKMLQFHKKDFKAILRQLKNKPLTVRYLDPPFHEFMPTKESEISALAKELGITKRTLNDYIDKIKEVNPMMGHRGSRLAVTYPALIKMQTKAVFEAAKEVKKEGINSHIELMIPLISDENELIHLIELIKEEISLVLKNKKINYQIGTMIEVPRAAIIANKLAKHVDFFSFGTNDLTQMTYGFSRDDAAKFFKSYEKIFTFDPFIKLDEKGVGFLIKHAINIAREVNPNLKMGICGEHGGNPSCIPFFNQLKLDYVSCSPFRVPGAILTIAQLAIKEDEENLEIIKE